MPAQKWDLDGVQLAKLQRLVRKTHEKQLRDDPSKRPNQQPRVVLKLVAMEELVRDEFVKNRINNLPYNIVNYLCTMGDEHRLRIELAAGAYNVNQRDGATGRTALICAIAAGHLPIVRMLVLEHHADVNRPSLLGRTSPLHFAIVGNFRQIASTLITFGADVHAANIVGATPLHLAHSVGLIKLLLRFHANPIQRSNEGLTPLEFYRKYTRAEPEERLQEVEETLTQAEDEAMIKLFKADTSLAHVQPPAITAGQPVAQSTGAKAYMKFATKK
jgi:ankyrin repeat protein